MTEPQKVRCSCRSNYSIQAYSQQTKFGSVVSCRRLESYRTRVFRREKQGAHPFARPPAKGLASDALKFMLRQRFGFHTEPPSADLTNHGGVTRVA